MKRLFLIAVPAIAIILFSCSGKTKQEKEKASYEKAKESLEEKERKNPLQFLTVSSKDKHNIIGQTVIKGSVNNHAKVCAYKDVALEILYYSKTGTLLEKDAQVIYDEVQPGAASDFKIKNFAPKGTDSVAIKILSAKIK